MLIWTFLQKYDRLNLRKTEEIRDFDGLQMLKN